MSYIKNMFMLIFILLSINIVSCSLKQKPLNSPKLNKTEIIDASTITSDIGKKCYFKFSNLINSFPNDVKNLILLEFKNNQSNDLCCNSSSLADKLGKLLGDTLNELTDKITKDSKKSKSGLACYKNPNFSTETQSQNDEFVKKMLLDFNTVNSNLAKCIIEINKITMKNILYICGNDSFHQKVFNFEDGFVTKPKKSREDNTDLFNECIDYIKTLDNYSNTVLGGLIDQINNLIGIDSCNYFSNQFTFNPSTDDNDPLFTKTNPINYSYKELLNKWLSCAKQKDSVGTADLYEKVSSIDSSYGLASVVDGYEIDYDIIKKTFNLEKYDFFSVHCRDMTCSALCKDCFSLEWEKDKVLLNSEVKLDVSCCDRICVVYIKGRNDKKGAEVFYMTEDLAKRDIDELILKKIKNANKCLKKDSNLFNSTIDDQKLLNKVDKIIENSKEYHIDSRFKAALEVKLNIDGNKIKLSDYLVNTLLKDNYSFLLNCENGNCLFDCPNCGVKEYKLEKSSDVNDNGLIKVSASYSNKKSGSFFSSSKPSSSFSSKPSSSFSSKPSSSFSSKPSGGSSLTSNYSSKPSGGSSLTNNYSSNTSKPSGGSSLTNNYSSNTSKPSGGSSLTNNYSNNYSNGGSSYSSGNLYNQNGYNTGNYRPNNQNSYNSGSYSPNNQGYNNYVNQNSYTTQTFSNYNLNYNKPYKIDNNNIKITNKYYYDYLPAYYNYSPYRYDYYYYNRNYYYRPYYNTYSNNSNNINQSNNINDINYDPTYWFPNISKIYDEKEIANIIDNKLNDLKIFIQCCDVFCIIFVDSIKEIGDSNKPRIYLDIILKNYAFIQASQLSNKQKQCLVNKFFLNNSSIAKTMIQLNKSKIDNPNIFSECEIPSVYDIPPIKSECKNTITDVCNNDRFENIFNRVRRNDKKCISFSNCLSDIKDSSQIENCGDKLSSLFLDKGTSIDIHSLHLPCIDKETNINLLQISQSGEYIDVNSFTNNEKKILEEIDTNVSNNAQNNIVIDNSTPFKASQDILTDLKNIDDELNSFFAKMNIFLIILIIIIV